MKNFNKLKVQYGEAYYYSVDKNGNNKRITGINEIFWAALYNTEHTVLYEPDERSFYCYNEKTGLHEGITEDKIKQDIAHYMLKVSRKDKVPDLEQKRTNRNLNNIIGHLRGLSEKR